MKFHRCRCHVCGIRFLLRTYRDNIEFPIHWPDGLVVYACDLGHKPAHIREAYELTFVRGEGLDERVIDID